MNIDYRPALLGALIVLLIILLLVSTAISYKLLKRNRFLSRELTWALLDPLRLNHFDEQSVPKVASTMTTVLFYGDSRAAAWPDPEITGFFQFVNRGIDGQSSAQTAQRFEAHVVPIKPDVVIVQVCVNDLWRIPILPQEKNAIIQACQENLSQIVAKSEVLGATVLLTTIFPVQDPPLLERMYWSADVYEGIDMVNTFIHSLAGENVVVLDSYTLLADENGRLQDQYTADYLHVNDAGYDVLNKALIELLKKSADQPRN